MKNKKRKEQNLFYILVKYKNRVRTNFEFYTYVEIMEKKDATIILFPFTHNVLLNYTNNTLINFVVLYKSLEMIIVLCKMRCKNFNLNRLESI